MKSEEFNFKNVLEKEASNIGITLDNDKLEKFEMYKDILLEWNKVMNLTAITDEYEVILKHFIDCLEMVRYIPKASNVIDIGTGAGFPGIVIAIYFDNDISITLLDSLNKRIEFLKEVVNKLKLQNISVMHARAEEYAHKEAYREMYDIAVSRAVAPLNILLEYDIPYIKVGGKALLLKGNNVEEEIKESKNTLSILGCIIANIFKYSYKVKEEIYNRNILEIEKVKKCPSKYPRNYGKIKKNPLK